MNNMNEVEPYSDGVGKTNECKSVRSIMTAALSGWRYAKSVLCRRCDRSKTQGAKQSARKQADYDFLPKCVLQIAQADNMNEVEPYSDGVGKTNECTGVWMSVTAKRGASADRTVVFPTLKKHYCPR